MTAPRINGGAGFIEAETTFAHWETAFVRWEILFSQQKKPSSHWNDASFQSKTGPSKTNLIYSTSEIAHNIRCLNSRFTSGPGNQTIQIIMKKYIAEFFGTSWLVLGGCGSAVLAAAFPNVGIGLLGVSLAFGLTVLTMACAIGHISGCHLNPAVSIGLWVGGRFSGKHLPGYIIAQVLGGLAGAAILYLIARMARAIAEIDESFQGLRVE